LADDPVIMAAGRLGERYHVDPLAILDVSDTDWVIRIACDKVVERDHERARNAKNPKSIFD
jgi:hypothetical protein